MAESEEPTSEPQKAELKAVGKGTLSANTQIKRGDRSWAYITMVLLFVISVGGLFVFEAEGPFWAKVLIFICASGIIGAFFLFSPKLHSLLLRFRRNYEDRWH